MTDKTCPFCKELPHSSDFDTYHGMRWCCTKECPLYLKVISVEQWNTRGGIKQLGADEMSMPKRIEELEAEIERLKKDNERLSVAYSLLRDAVSISGVYKNSQDLCDLLVSCPEEGDELINQIKAEAVREFGHATQFDLGQTVYEAAYIHAARLEGDK